MKRFLKDIRRLLEKNGISLLIFEILYRFFFHEAVTRTARAAVDISLKYQGYSYMTEENFMEFISHPLTGFLIILGLLLVILLVLFEICAVYGCLEASWKKQRISVPEMLYAGGAGCLSVIRRRPFSWPILIGASLPCLMLQAFYGMITNFKLLQITAVKIFQAFPNLVLPAALAVCLTAGSILFAFTLPFRVLMEEKEKQVFRQTKASFGKDRTEQRKRLREELVRYFGVQLSVFFLLLAAYFISHVLIVLYVMAVGKPQALVSSVLVYADGAKAILGQAAMSAGITGSLGCQYLFFHGSIRKGYHKQRKKRKLPTGIRGFFSTRTVAIVLTVLLAVTESVYLIYTVKREHPRATASSDYISVSAHRGGARKAPENTLSALEYAIESKSDFAEIDVQETKDGEIVLMHDTSLKRTTGLNAKVWTMTYDELCQLDAGVRFHKSFRGEKIPTLKEAIETARGRIQLNIEVKYNGHNPNIVRKVVRIIEEEEFVDNCVLTSMNYKFLEQAKKLNPDIRTGYTMNMTYGDLKDMSSADCFSVKYTYISERFVERVHSLGKEVYAWTLNYQGDIQRIVNCGVDNIITDDPELVRRVILGDTSRDPGFWELLKFALK